MTIFTKTHTFASTVAATAVTLILATIPDYAAALGFGALFKKCSQKTKE